MADFGTATAYDLVNEKGEFVAEITSPRLEISARALYQQAAELRGSSDYIRKKQRGREQE